MLGTMQFKSSRTTRSFSDIDISFNIHPLTGDIIRLKDDDAIKRSMRNLVLTNFHERPFNSYMGGNIRALLFENPSVFMEIEVRDAVRNVIRFHEPRVELIDINSQYSPDENSYLIEIFYKIVGDKTIQQFDLNLKRLR